MIGHKSVEMSLNHHGIGFHSDNESAAHRSFQIQMLRDLFSWQENVLSTTVMVFALCDYLCQSVDNCSKQFNSW